MRDHPKEVAGRLGLDLNITFHRLLSGSWKPFKGPCFNEAYCVFELLLKYHTVIILHTHIKKRLFKKRLASREYFCPLISNSKRCVGARASEPVAMVAMVAGRLQPFPICRNGFSPVSAGAEILIPMYNTVIYSVK